jgi:uncharacterized ferritin-like protein (DUF455 family)
MFVLSTVVILHYHLPTELRLAALAALLTADTDEKVALVHALWSQAATLSIATGTLAEPLHIPGRPAKPLLMQHLNVSKRSPYTPEGLAALGHAVCHIEFNAINLVLDAAWRFEGMPTQYYPDWLRVADEEAMLFSLLAQQLRSMGYVYGDFPAHTGLWDMTEKAKGDVVARMALVPLAVRAGWARSPGAFQTAMPAV